MTEVRGELEGYKVMVRRYQMQVMTCSRVRPDVGGSSASFSKVPGVVAAYLYTSQKLRVGVLRGPLSLVAADVCVSGNSSFGVFPLQRSISRNWLSANTLLG